MLAVDWAACSHLTAECLAVARASMPRKSSQPTRPTVSPMQAIIVQRSQYLLQSLLSTSSLAARTATACSTHLYGCRASHIRKASELGGCVQSTPQRLQAAHLSQRSSTHQVVYALHVGQPLALLPRVPVVHSCALCAIAPPEQASDCTCQVLAREHGALVV